MPYAKINTIFDKIIKFFYMSVNTRLNINNIIIRGLIG